uniref:Uncharacterized protein n=1 Tax=Arundo donax TaxID=35708 RepID=A0A0A8Z8V3_ARUDO
MLLECIPSPSTTSIVMYFIHTFPCSHLRSLKHVKGCQATASIAQFKSISIMLIVPIFQSCQVQLHVVDLQQNFLSRHQLIFQSSHGIICL